MKSFFSLLSERSFIFLKLSIFGKRFINLDAKVIVLADTVRPD